MMKLFWLFQHPFILILILSGFVFAQEEQTTSEPSDSAPPAATTLEEIPTQLAGLSAKQFADLVAKSRQSVVMITFTGRAAETQGTGSGFILKPNGIIATNRHVIGDSRPITVQLEDGREFDVKEIVATNTEQDLAILKIDADNLPALEIASPKELHQGQPVFALGNPQGLNHSVVTGIVSAVRQVGETREMIQLAIPIEPGNSGGPLLDMQGKVHGLLTLKSQVSENLGYAVPAAPLNEMLESSRPISMDRWLTIGALNPRLWEVSGEANWRQRAGRIHASGSGRGFAGRSLCHSKITPPELPYEIGVDVKITEKDGAAGLIFHSDGGDKHYGFYPSSGKFRFVRFEGPTVYEWNVLDQITSPHFIEGDWNRLKIRVEKDRIQCFCNDHLIYETTDNHYTSGRVGLAKYRHTTAEFRRFQIAPEITSDTPSAESLEELRSHLNDIPLETLPSPETVDQIASLAAATPQLLQQEAKILERRAERLRQLAQEVHENRVRQELVAAVSAEPPQLGKAALLVAALDNQELIVEDYESMLDDLANQFREQQSETLTPEELMENFHRFLFEEQGFHGSRTNYYDASNSYLNETIDDREGLPITLAVLYLELAKRIGLNAEGVGLPGHFIVRVDLPEEDQPRFIDVFERGIELSKEDCQKIVEETGRSRWSDSYLDVQSADAIIVRMLRNLIERANQKRDAEPALRYVRTILELRPDSADDRLFRAVLCYTTGRVEEGLQSVNWVLEREPATINMQRVHQLKESLLELQKSNQ